MHRHGARRVLRLAERVFGEPAQARQWLNRPSVQLGGRTPLEVLGSEDGARRVEELLRQIDDDDRLNID
ncbi:MAG TPA: MbcA/ParS/Xre antitoxin family protein [Burkholderiales bacterium]|nr:MbcA/ParS/Xre antitoxin family protein [Burkholderiales bacterium]